MKKCADLIYGTGRAIRNYEESNPEEKVLIADGSKGIMTAGNQDVTRGANWVTSQRSVIMLTDSKIICGKWTIPIEQVQSSELLKVSSLFGSGYVLKIQTIEGDNYQFGMQLNTEWVEQKVLPLKLEKGELKHSLFSIVARVIVFGYLIYWAYESFFAN